MKLDITREILQTIGHTADSLGLQAYIIGEAACAEANRELSSEVSIGVKGGDVHLAQALAEDLPNATVISSEEGVTVETGTNKIIIKNLVAEENYDDNWLREWQSEQPFTILTTAISINHDSSGTVYDELGGIDDYNSRLLRTCGDADILFSAQPLAILYAVEIASRLHLRIETRVVEAMRNNAAAVDSIDIAKIAAALNKIISGPGAAAGFKALDMTGVLERVLPEITALKGVQTIDGHGHKDNFEHTLKVLDNIARLSDFTPLRWVALAHDIGKPRSKRYEPGIGWTFRNHDYLGEKMSHSMFRRLKIFNKEKIEYISKLIGLHMRPQQIGEEGVTDSAVRRMITDAGDADDLQDLMLLAEADLTSKNPVKVRRVLDTFAKVRQRLEQIQVNDNRRATPDIINGHEIMETFGIGSTPELGKIKADVCNIANTEGLTHAEAYQYMLDKASDYNLQPKENVEELRVSFEEQYQNRMAEREHQQTDATAKKLERDIALGRVKNQ